MNFSDLGVHSAKDADSFKKIQYFSKTNPQSLFSNASDFSSRYLKLSDLYLSEPLLSNSSTYGTYRQHNYTSRASYINNYNSTIDASSLKKHVDYNLKFTPSSNGSDFSQQLTSVISPSTIPTNAPALRIPGLMSSGGLTNYDSIFTGLSQYPAKTTLTDNLTDQKAHKNPFKYALTEKNLKTEMSGKDLLSDIYVLNEIETSSNLHQSAAALTNNSVNYRFKDLKSTNLGILSSDRNTRLIGDMFVGKTNRQFDGLTNNLNSLINLQLNTEAALPSEKLFNTSLAQ